MAAAAAAAAAPAPAVAAAVVNTAADYEAAIFFDNADNHINQVRTSCPYNVKLVKVNETAPYYDIRGIRHSKPVYALDQEPLKSYLASLGDNLYHQMLLNFQYTDDTYDHVSGINDANLATGRAWIASTADKAPRAAIFDWDRTITVFEGIVPVKDPRLLPYFEKFITETGITYEQFLKDAVLYFAGGATRLEKLRTFMRELHAAGIAIHILTNNDGCGEEYYTDLVKTFFGDIPYSSIICSKDYRGDKGKALFSTPRFKKICMFSYGGGRKRSVRRRGVRRQGKRTLRRRRKH